MSYPITAHVVSFEFPNGHKLFQNLNFSLSSGITALVGPNGVGKTSLAKLLTGELEPTKGSVIRNGSVSFLPQREEPLALSVQEFLSTSYEWSLLKEKLLENISPESLCTHLSGGEWMRVRLAKYAHDNFLILDEPTNDLDRNGRDLILDFIRERQGGTLVISHDRECLSLCSEVLELSNKGLSKYGGGWKFYENAKQHERENLNRALSLAKRNRDESFSRRHELQEKQEKRNRQGQKAADRGGLPKILIGARKRRAQVSTGKIDVATFEKTEESIRDLHEALAEVKIDPVMYASLMSEALPSQKLIFEAQNFNIQFNDWIYKNDLNIVLRGNIRLHLKGANGSGKSTLLKAIMGEKFNSRGLFKTGNLKTLYIDQRCAHLENDKSLFENIRSSSTLDESEIRNRLALFLFTKDKVFQKIQDLSGGERLRATLAKSFLQTEKPELLILDEPTNNLDLANIKFLENLVNQFPAALIIISHDEVFAQNCQLREVLEI